MTKKELISCLASKSDCTQTEVDKIITELSACIIQACKDDDDITLPGIGKFSQKRRESRNVRNPRTGETMVSAAKNVPVFKASSNFKAEIN